MNFIQKMLAKYLGPKVISRFVASTVAFVAAWLATNLPDVAPEAVQQFASGLSQILIGGAGLLLAYFIDAKADKE